MEFLLTTGLDKIFWSFLSNFQTKFDITVKTLIKRSALSCAHVARQTKVSVLREQMKTFRNPLSSCQTVCRFTTTISRIFLSNFLLTFSELFSLFLIWQEEVLDISCWSHFDIQKKISLVCAKHYNDFTSFIRTQWFRRNKNELVCRFITTISRVFVEVLCSMF